MRYLMLSLMIAVLALLLTATGCKKKPAAAGTDSATVVETTSQMTPDQQKTKERLERPLFKRPDYEPPPTYAGTCANCGQKSDKLTQIDPFVKEIGGTCSEKCMNEWLEKHRNNTGAPPSGPAPSAPK
ncbi:MAG: hypothetical protein ACYC6A_05945 [Armatimonadota bacterium]